MFRSVRVRLTVWYTALLGLLLTLFALFGYALLARALQVTADTSLSETADDFVDTWLTETRLERARDVAEVARLAATDFRYKDRTVQVFDAQGRMITSSEEPSPASARTAGSIVERLIADSRSGTAYSTVPGSSGDEIRIMATHRRVGGRAFTIVVFRSLQQEVLRRMRRTFLLGIPLGLAIAALSGWFLAYKSLQPVVAMARQASGISAGSLHQRIGVVKQDDELGRLAAVLNDLLGRLEQSFTQQHRLLTDASHELRTPVSIIRGEAEVALSRTGRSAEEYRDALSIIHEESRRMTEIVENLFTMARAEVRQHPLIATDFYLEELVSECIRALRTPSSEKGVVVITRCEEEMPIRGDEGLLHRLLLNLLQNALKHTPRGGRIEVAASRTENGYRMTVSDNGSGIPAEAQPFIFEPFFRVDKARSRSESAGGGAGLGLAIARWIARLHGGAIELVRSDPTGSVFAVTLPASPPLEG